MGKNDFGTGRLDFSSQNGYNRTIIIVIYAMTQEK